MTHPSRDPAQPICQKYTPRIVSGQHMGSSIADAPVEAMLLVRANPILARCFEEKYGDGTAALCLGTH